MKTSNSKRGRLQVVLLTLGLIACGGTNAMPDSFSDGTSAITASELRTEILAMPPEVKQGMNKASFTRFVETLLLDRRLATQAKASGQLEKPEVKARIDRATREVLVKSLLTDKTAELQASLPDLTGLAKEQYAANQSAHAIPEAIRVAHILIRPEGDGDEQARAAKEKAESILNRLRQGADFGELAKTESSDLGSKSQGGRLPDWMNKGSLVPGFEEAAYALKPGELSGVVRTRFGYHIIRLDEHRPARVQTFDEVKEGIIGKLRNEALSRKRTEWLQPYLAKQPVEIDDASVEELLKK